MMQLGMDLILRAGQTFRGAAKALAVFAEHCLSGLATPCANTVELWLLRLGHYLLHCPLPVGDDWVLVADLTMTIGSQKVLVIAGCRLSQIPFGIRNLAPTDLHLVHLAVLERSTHETILAELRVAIGRTGIPRCIDSDEGSDILKAVRRLLQEYPSIAHLLDMAHAGANLLKNRWTADPRWREFLQKLAQTNQRIRQTELAYLLSPRQRDKGRFMSVGVLLRFARRVLYWLDKGDGGPNGEDKYGWLKEYREDLKRWGWEQQIVQQTIEEVRLNGWEKATLGLLEEMWRQMPAEYSNAGLVADLRAFATKMIAQAKPDETLPGSTEALESAFGGWKQWVEAGPSVGVSRLVLGLGSALKPVPPEDYQKAMEETPVKQVWQWLEKTVGTTAQKLRTIFNRQTKPALA
jgi:hypothetical protein